MPASSLVAPPTPSARGARTAVTRRAARPTWGIRRLVLAAATTVVAAAAAVAVLAAVDLLRVRRDVQAGQSQLQLLDLTTLDQGISGAVAEANQHLQAADERARSSRWLSLASVVPGISQQVDGVRDLAAATAGIGRLATTAAGRIEVALDEAGGRPGARVALLDTILDEVTVIQDGLDGVDLGRGAWLLPPISGARAELADKVAKAQADLADAHEVVAGLREFLVGPGDYLILGGNNAEMTGGSGMPLSAGVAHIENGAIEVGNFVPTSDLWLGDRTVPAQGDVGFLYAQMGIGTDFRGTTATPNFRGVAPLMRQMVARTPLGDVDGIFLVDAIALQSLVAVTGPVQVGPTTYDATNVVDEILNRNYIRFPGIDVRNQRTQLQSQIARVVFDALESREIALGQLVAGLDQAAQGRHLMAWSSNPQLQGVWQQIGADGAMRPDSFAVSVENNDANKLDYYLAPQASLTALPDANDDSWRVRLQLAVSHPDIPELTGVLGHTPEVHWVFLDLHLPMSVYDYRVIDEEFDGVGIDGVNRVLTVQYPVEIGTTKTIVVEFSVPKEVTGGVLMPGARVHPLKMLVGGRVITDAVETPFTWVEPPPEPWTVARGLGVGVVAAAGLLAAAALVAIGRAGRTAPA